MARTRSISDESILEAARAVQRQTADHEVRGRQQHAALERGEHGGQPEHQEIGT